MKRKEQAYGKRSKAYVSEFEQFLANYMTDHPGVEKDQQRGWYIWWDRPVNFDELERERRDAVPLKAYYYE